MINEKIHILKIDDESLNRLTKEELYKLLERKFVDWMVTQRNLRGTLYLERVVWQYVRYLKSSPKKLDITLSVDKRNIFACLDTAKFDEIYKAFLAAPNFKSVNENGHQSFSAGLAAYRRYVQFLEKNEKIVIPEVTCQSKLKIKNDSNPATTVEPQVVDFGHPELCAGCDPMTCIVEGNNFSGGNWRDVLVILTEAFLKNKPKAAELYYTSIYPHGEHVYLLKDKPKFSAKQLSNGYWINVNLSIKDLVFTIGKLCEFCGVDLNDVCITYIPKQGEAKIRTMAKVNDDSARFAQQTVRDAFRAWLTANNPKWGSDTVTMHYSAAYYLYSHNCGITLAKALIDDNGLKKAYDAIEVFYTENPTKTNTPSGSAHFYLRSLRMLKDFLVENYPELLIDNSAVSLSPRVPNTVIETLTRNYASGFRFDTTYINLLSNASGVEVDTEMQAALKQKMFLRDDGIYFLYDIVADAAIRKDIIDFADAYLIEYGCFEILEFYKLYEDKINPNCIRNADDFESLYEQISNSSVRCVGAPNIGNRIARYSGSAVWTIFMKIATKIVSVITDEYYGSCNEDDLHTKFCAFSTDLLGKIIKQCAADKLIRVEINDSVCYQTFDALGLPENFPEVVAETLERLDYIGLELTQNTLHTAISLNLGVNFMAEFNLPDWETFRLLIAAIYKSEPRREWKSNIFVEVTA